MLLKVFYHSENGSYVGETLIEGQPKYWWAETLIGLKKKAGSFVGRSHRYGTLEYISKVRFIEGTPKEDTAFLETEPEVKRRRRRRRTAKTTNLYERYQAATNEPTTPKDVEDNTEYLYKEESGYLKIYRKELCKSFKVSVFN